MFKINDYIIYGGTGVCQIADIRKEELCGDETEYYILHPVYAHNMTIKTPVNTKILMRRVLTKEEVLTLIAAMPHKETCWIQDQKERSIAFKAALKSREIEEMIKIIRTIYLEKQTNAKKITKTDLDLMNAAENQLCEEFAIALNIQPADVIPFIQSQITSLGALQEST